MNSDLPGRRTVIVGDSGSGKTTLAQWLGAQLHIHHIELDSIYWQPDWGELSTAEFCRRVSEAINRSSWVLDGNYSKVRHLTWAAADTLIWLDFSLAITLPRLIQRSIKRVLSKELLWGTNRERGRSLFSADSLILYNLKRHASRKKEYNHLLSTSEYQHLKVIRLQNHNEVKRWQKIVLAAL